jgi:hypothetical protein
MADKPREADAVGADQAVMDIPKAKRDGLEGFTSHMFVDPELAPIGYGALLGEANRKYNRLRDPHDRAASSATEAKRLRLTGIHSLLPIDEVTLVAVPDSVHWGWKEWPNVPPAPLQRPHLNEVSFSDDPHSCTLSWKRGTPQANYVLQQSDDPGFSQPSLVDRTSDKKKVVTVRSDCPVIRFYRVRAERGLQTSPWSNIVKAVIPHPDFWHCDSGPDYDSDDDPISPPGGGPVDTDSYFEAAPRFTDQTILAVHRAVLRFCAARGDMVAVLSLPQHYLENDISAYLQRLSPGTSTGGQENGGEDVPPLTSGESKVLEYGALYHPWVGVGSTSNQNADRVRFAPPDGAACGTMALRALARGAWTAPANEPLTGVVSLNPDIDRASWATLYGRGVNIIRNEPRGFIVLSEDTLSREEATRPINVRRLLILLRRLTLREGNKMVFHNNDRRLRRITKVNFQRVLSMLYARGAFAGDAPEKAYQVVADGSVNTPADVDRGMLITELRVAPSRPMSFLTVRVIQKVGGGLTLQEL